MRKILGWLVVLLWLAPIVRAQDQSRLLEPGQPTEDIIDASSPIHVYAVETRFAADRRISLQNTGVVALTMTLVDAAGEQLNSVPYIPGGVEGAMRWLSAGGATYHIVVAPAEPLADHQAQFTLTLGQPPLDTPYALQFFLTWQAAARLSLEVRDPLGQSLHWQSPQTEDGGTFSTDTEQPVDCAAYAPHTETQSANWQPQGLPTGSYEILVHYLDGCVDAVPFRLEVRLYDLTFPAFTATLHPDETFVSGFLALDDGTGAVNQRSGIVETGTTIMISTADLLASAQPLPPDGVAQDRISGDAPYRSYAFEGQLGDVISAAVTRLSGNLDSVLALLDSNGNLLAVNDDSADGITDSAITSVRLRRNGTYLLVVTRYAQLIGATEGDFELAVGGAEN